MSLIRIQVDLAIPVAEFSDVPKSMIAQIQKLKGMAVKINEGKDNEEDTTRAVWHRCHHDIGDKPCEPEQEIQKDTI